MPRFIASLFILAAMLGSVTASAQTELIENGGFETGNLASWTAINLPGGDGDWIVYSGNEVFPLPVPPAGNFAAVTVQGDPGSHVLLQNIAIPAGAEVTCSLIYYYDGAANFVIGPGLTFDIDDNQQARIDILSFDADPFTVSGGVLQNLFQTQPGDPTELGYTTLDFDLTPFAGTIVTFRAAEVDNLGAFNFAIDEVSCISDTAFVEAIPTLGEWGMMAMAGVLGITGLLYARRKRAA